MIKIVRTTGSDPDFKLLTQKLDAELSALYQTNSADFSDYNQLDDLKTVVLAYNQERPVGCGCFRDYAAGVAELKRMYVIPEMRGSRIATGIITEMEQWAMQSGIRKFILETGDRQPAAITFYNKLGYLKIEKYDQYKGIATSICMEKTLTLNQQTMSKRFLGLRTTIYKVTDLEAGKKWYNDAFETEPYFDEPFYVGYNIAGYELGLQEGALAHSEAENVVTYWGVENAEKEFDRLLELGATGHEVPTNVGGEIVVASVRDPWGNVIGLIYNPEFKL